MSFNYFTLIGYRDRPSICLSSEKDDRSGLHTIYRHSGAAGRLCRAQGDDLILLDR
jgi:hypothetical protein